MSFSINMLPVGTYTDVTGVIAAGPAAEIVALIATLKALIPDPTDTVGIRPASPDFLTITPGAAHLLLAELNAMEAAIAAAPVA